MHKKTKTKSGLKLQKYLGDSKNIQSCLIDEKLRLNNLNQEQGSSSWLTSLSLAEEGHDSSV